MISMRVRHTTKHRGASPADVRRAVRLLNSTDIFVGIPQAANRERGDITEAQLLYIQEHGVRRAAMRNEMQGGMDAGHTYHHAYDLYIHEHGSPLWQIPPRPVLAPAMAAAHQRLMQLYEVAARDAWAGKDPRPALERVGARAAYAAQAWFTDPRNNWPPNAPSTIRDKHSSRPLIDTGELRRSITYELRPKR